MKTLYKMIIAVGLLGVLSACVHGHGPGHYYRGHDNYYGQGGGYRPRPNPRYQGHGYSNNSYSGYRHSPYGHGHGYQQRPYYTDDD
ncbi:hypothetical protein [Methyloglobulus sp.]|uniref:hypothetical protein n=1 Tax=Methyloglobulus sp. TaxID=2518622 RepID=UPI0032B7CA26